MIENKANKPLELYIHIPFCVKKCNYCDFLSAPADKMTIHNYMEALKYEAQARRRTMEGYEIVSIFLGGGTPSLARPEEVGELLEYIGSLWPVQKDAEITIEVNPGTVGEQALEIYKRAGMNRLSIGLQSVHEDELRLLGRIHGYEEFLKTYAEARKAGFQNINVDLMSGLPGQTGKKLEESLERVTSLIPLPEHISVYSLIVEEGTPFYAERERGELCLPDEEEDRRMYERAASFLRERGYVAYEISNYAREGCACRHNTGYWTRQEYLGLGIGAASLIGERRFSNGESLQAYLEDPVSVWGQMQTIGIQEQMEETMFLGLRLTEGVSASGFARRFGRPLSSVYGEVITKNIRDGLLEEKDGRLRLTERGRNLANYVMAQFLLD